MCKNLEYLLLICAFMTNVNTAIGQRPNSSQVDSLLSYGIKNIYENPDESIAVGMSIYDNPKNLKKKKIKGLMLVSVAYTSKRDYQKALEYINKANELSEGQNDQVLQLEILFRIGTIYQQLKIYDKSIEFMEKVERLSLSFPVRDSVGIFLANSYIVKGFIYKDNLNCDIALEYFDKGIQEYENLKTEHNTNLSIVYYNRGNCYTLLSEYDSAKISFNKSIAFAESEKAKSLIAFAQKGLAEVYTLEGEYEKAIFLLQTAMEQSFKVGDLILNSTIYKGLFENYLALNQWNNYQKYYDLYVKTRLEITKSERNSISDSIEENSKSQAELIKNLQSDFSKKLNWAIAVIVLITLSVLFIERKNRKTIRSLKKRIESFQTQISYSELD